MQAETILAALKAQRAVDEQASAVRRQKDAARQKRWRASRRMSHVSRVTGVTLAWEHRAFTGKCGALPRLLAGARGAAPSHAIQKSHRRV